MCTSASPLFQRKEKQEHGEGAQRVEKRNKLVCVAGAASALCIGVFAGASVILCFRSVPQPSKKGYDPR